MTRRLLVLVMLGALAASLVVGAGAPASAQDYLPYVTINQAPDGAKVAAGEHLEMAQFTNSRPLAEGAVGPLPVFFADDEWGCIWTTAQASGLTEWIGLARRSVSTTSDPCALFQAKITAATLAGADGLVLINNAGGTATGTAAGVISGGIIDQEQGNRLRDSLNPATPQAVKVTLELLDSETFLPVGVPRPTVVSSVEASADGGALTVTGTAAFGGEAPVLIAPDEPGDGPIQADVSRELGVDLTGARIYQPDPADPTLVFEWQVTNLPATGTLPETIRYLFPFTVANKGYQLQAKLSNLATTTFVEDPQGHVDHTGSAFQVRGNCGPGPGGITTCAHLGWVTGQFDVAANTVRARVPIGGSIIPDLLPGAVLTRNVVAGATIAASYQVVLSLNPTTTDEAVWEEEVTFTVPSVQVLLAIGPAGTDPGELTFDIPATVAADGSFSATVDVSGLDPGAYDVHAQACFATNCGVGQVTVTL